MRYFVIASGAEPSLAKRGNLLYRFFKAERLYKTPPKIATSSASWRTPRNDGQGGLIGAVWQELG